MTQTKVFFSQITKRSRISWTIKHTNLIFVPCVWLLGEVGRFSDVSTFVELFNTKFCIGHLVRIEPTTQSTRLTLLIITQYQCTSVHGVCGRRGRECATVLEISWKTSSIKYRWEKTRLGLYLHLSQWCTMIKPLILFSV